MQVLRQRTYSVEMTEEELRLFSEFLEERNYGNPLSMASAYKQAVSGVGKLGKGELKQIVNARKGISGDRMNSFIQQGRQMRQGALGKVGSINRKINERAISQGIKI